ncbi:hypothetical protein [Streptomyces sp. NPDC047097]|uniref:hypothetical protein n=1 Tax=Streptomyces sp. NPDC047097 TaxID=3155260 RepID=UPI0033E79DA2
MFINPEMHRKRMEFGKRSAGLLAEAGLSPAGYATRVGVSRAMVDKWCKAEAAPRGTNARLLRQLVSQPHGAFGETAGFGDAWHHPLESARQEGADHLGHADGRGGLREWLARFGAELYVYSALQDRVAELRAMRDFVQATGSDAPSYLWWQGASRARKSALLAHFLKELPADDWQGRGWPTSTPRYLLSHYPGLLDGRRGRRERYVRDPRRQTRMVAEGLTDEALGRFDLVAGTEGADLTLAARVDASRDLLARQARPVLAYFARLFALAGDTARARELALSAPKAADRAVSLSKVIEVFGQEGRARSGELAHEAAHWAQYAMAADRARTYAGGEPPSGALVHVGCRLRSSGHREAGVAVLRSVVACEAMGWAARVTAAKKLGADSPGCLVALVERAEKLVRGGPQGQAEALELVLELSATLARVVHALLVVGQPVAAKGLLDEVPDRLRTDVLGDDIREAAFAVLEPGGAVYSGAEAEPVEPAQVAAIEEALRRHPARGERLLAEAFGQWEGETAAVGGPVWRLPLAEALAAGGQVEEAVRLAGGAGEAGLRARGLAAVSMGCSASRAAAEAARYAREAAAEAEGLEDAVVRGAVAQALAHSGDAEAAERWTRGEGARGTSRHQDEQSRTAVAVGLAPYDPGASGRLVAERLVLLERSARAPYREVPPRSATRHPASTSPRAACSTAHSATGGPTAWGVSAMDRSQLSSLAPRNGRRLWRRWRLASRGSGRWCPLPRPTGLKRIPNLASWRWLTPSVRSRLLTRSGLGTWYGRCWRLSTGTTRSRCCPGSPRTRCPRWRTSR